MTTASFHSIGGAAVGWQPIALPMSAQTNAARKGRGPSAAGDRPLRRTPRVRAPLAVALMVQLFLNTVLLPALRPVHVRMQRRRNRSDPAVPHGRRRRRVVTWPQHPPAAVLIAALHAPYNLLR